MYFLLSVSVPIVISSDVMSVYFNYFKAERKKCNFHISCKFVNLVTIFKRTNNLIESYE